MFVILVPAVIVLWGFHGRDRRDAWSWTIMPDLTPIFLGAGYGAGAYFFLRTFLGERWPPSSAGVFGAAFFATLMLIATLIHWARFNHGDAPTLAAIAFYGWVVVYIVSAVRRRRALSGSTTPRIPASRCQAEDRSCRARATRRAAFGIGAFGAAIVFFAASPTRRSTSGRGSSRRSPRGVLGVVHGASWRRRRCCSPPTRAGAPGGCWCRRSSSAVGLLLVGTLARLGRSTRATRYLATDNDGVDENYGETLFFRLR